MFGTMYVWYLCLVPRLPLWGLLHLSPASVLVGWGLRGSCTVFSCELSEVFCLFFPTVSGCDHYVEHDFQAGVPGAAAWQDGQVLVSAPAAPHMGMGPFLHQVLTSSMACECFWVMKILRLSEPSLPVLLPDPGSSLWVGAGEGSHGHGPGASVWGCIWEAWWAEGRDHG